MLTFEGVIFIGLALLIGAAATNTGTNLLYLIVSLMFGFLLVSGFLSKRAVRKLTVERHLPRHVVAGESIGVRIAVKNGKRVFSSYGLQVSDEMDDGTVAGHCYLLHAAPGERVAVTYPCVFHRRGQYRFKQVVISTTYPFGFVRRSVRFPAPRDVLVYPQILPWSELELETPPDLGERETHRKGPGSSLYGIREQQQGEGARWIHWKKTAQLERLMHREFEREEKKNVRLLFDNALLDPAAPKRREAFERVVIQCASVAHHLLRADHQVELVTRSGRVPCSVGPHQRHRILRALALIEPVAADGRKPLHVAADGDVATIVFRCDGSALGEILSRDKSVVVVQPTDSDRVAKSAASPQSEVSVR